MTALRFLLIARRCSLIVSIYGPFGSFVSLSCFVLLSQHHNTQPTHRVAELERYFARYEFSAELLLCCSDCESLTMAELLDMADDEMKGRW